MLPQVKLTGRKEDPEVYRRHSGFEGGLREERRQWCASAADPARRRGHSRMLRKPRWETRCRKLKVYAGRIIHILRSSQEDEVVIWPASNTTQQDAARHPPPAFSSPRQGLITVNHRALRTSPDRRAPDAGPPSAAADGAGREGRYSGDRRGGGGQRQAGAAGSALRARAVEFNAELRRQLKKDGLPRRIHASRNARSTDLLERASGSQLAKR